MQTQSANPYESPTSVGTQKVPDAEPSRWHGFRTGFRNGALWSLLLVVPSAPTFYGEMTIHRRIDRNTATGASRIIELSFAESAFASFVAIGTALTGITLPWAIIAGCVGQARSRRGPTDK